MRWTPLLSDFLPRGGWIVTTACLCWILGLTFSAVAETPRAPIPDAAKQREVSKLLDETYGLDKLETASKKQQAVKKLLEATRDESLLLEERYVALITLLKLTQEIADFTSWREAMDRLEKTYEIDGAKEINVRLKAYLNSASSSSAFRGKTAEEIAELIRQVARANRYSDAEALLAAADAAVQRVNASSAIKQAFAKAKDTVADRKKAWLPVEAAEKKLKTSPDDPAANQTVGRWLALYESEWTAAAEFLGKSQDAKWQDAARLEQEALGDPDKQSDTGDAWWGLAQSETGYAKTALMLHAGYWYELATPNLSAGVQKQLMAKRLSEIAVLKPVFSAKAGLNTKPVPANEPPSETKAPPKESKEWVDLLAWSEGMDWASRGPRDINWNLNLVAPPSSKGITITADRASKFPLPAIIDGDYEMEVEFTRIEGKDSVSVYFPVGIHVMHFECSGEAGSFSAVHYINGENGIREGSTLRRPSPIANGVRHKLLFRVKREGDQAMFQIGLDNEPNWIRWQGPYSSLTNVETHAWKPTLTRRPWLAGWLSQVEFHKVRVRMLSGSLRRDTITDTDREADLKNGFVRLIGQPAVEPRVGWGSFTISQLPVNIAGGDAERLWPLISPEPEFCSDFYGAHAPSSLKIDIPAGAKGFSVIGHNQASRATDYKIAIDGKEVYQSGVTDIQVIKIDIPAKSSKLELIATVGSEQGYHHVYWCYPHFHTIPGTKITEKALEGKPGPLKFVIASHEVGGGKLSHNEPLHPNVKAIPLNYESAIPCDEFLFAAANSSVKYAVPAGMTRFSAIGYNVRSNDVKYEVWAGGSMLYRSPQAGIIKMDVKLPPATSQIELRITALSNPDTDFSMWCFPRLYKK